MYDARLAFTYFDWDSNGTLEEAEFKIAVRALGLEVDIAKGSFDFEPQSKDEFMETVSTRFKPSPHERGGFFDSALEKGWKAHDIHDWHTVFTLFNAAKEEEEERIEGLELQSIMQVIGVHREVDNEMVLKYIKTAPAYIDFLDFLFLLLKCMSAKVRPPILDYLTERDWGFDELRSMRTVFTLYDVEQTRSLSCSQMKEALAALNVELAAEEEKKLQKDPMRRNFLQFLEATKDAEFNEKPRALCLVDELGWSVKRVTQYRTMFNIFDTDGGGSVSLEEMATVCESMGQNLTEEDIGEVLKDIRDCAGDDDNEEDLSFLDYLAFISVNELKNVDMDDDDVVYQEPPLIQAVDTMGWNTNSIKALRKSYASVARGKDEIDEESMDRLLLNLGQNPEDIFVKNVLAYTDVNGNGSFDFIEFLLAYSKIVAGLAAMIGGVDSKNDYFNFRDFALSLVQIMVPSSLKLSKRVAHTFSIEDFIIQRRRYVAAKLINAINTILEFAQSLSLQVRLQNMILERSRVTEEEAVAEDPEDSADVVAVYKSNAPTGALSPRGNRTARSFHQWVGTQRGRVGMSPHRCRFDETYTRSTDFQDWREGQEMKFRQQMEMDEDPSEEEDAEKPVFEEWQQFKRQWPLDKVDMIHHMPIVRVRRISRPKPKSRPAKKVPPIARYYPWVDEGLALAKLMESPVQKPPFASVHPSQNSLLVQEKECYERRTAEKWRESPDPESPNQPVAVRHFVPFTMRPGSAKEDTLSTYGVTNEDFFGLAETMLQTRVPTLPLKTLYFDETRLTQLSGEHFKKVFDEAPNCENLVLHGNYFESGILKVLIVAPPTLKKLDIAGTRLGPRAWGIFANALDKMTALSELSVARTQLGDSSQLTIVHFIEHLANCGRLQKLDVGGNYFQKEGCVALMEYLDESRVTHLIMSYNSGGPVETTYNDAEISWNNTREPEYNPLLIIVERINSVPYLKTLDLTFSNITYPCCLMIEGNVVTHPTLENLIIADNPIGVYGMECVIRLVAKSTVLKFVNIENCRNSAVVYDKVCFRSTNPSGDYILDMRNPFFREFARQCVKWCVTNNIDLSCFKQFRMGEKQSLPLPKDEFPPSEVNKRTRETSKGVLALSFNTDVMLKGLTNDDMIAKWRHDRTARISLTRFVLLAKVWRQCSTLEQCRMFLTALPRIATVKLGQAKWFAQDATQRGSLMESTDVLMYLCTCTDGNKMQVIDMAPRVQSRSLLFNEVRNSVLLNANNPTNHYMLVPSKLADYDVGERLFVLNRWEANLTLLMEIPDTTPLQNRQNIANLKVNGKEVMFDDSFRLPREANITVTFDYSSPIRVREDEPTIDQITIEVLRDAFSTCQMDIYSKIFALRKVSHSVVLTLEDLRYMIQLAMGARTMKEVVTACIQNLEEPRVELLLMFFNRCADRKSVCSPDVIYDPAFFTHKDIQVIRQKLFLLRTFDFMNVCQRQVMCKDGNTIIGNMTNRHRIKLSIPDGVRLMKYFIILGGKEEGENMMEIKYSEASFLKSADAKLGEMGDYWIPSTWNTDIPPVGIIEFSYMSEERYILRKERLKGGQDFGGWKEAKKLAASELFLKQ